MAESLRHVVVPELVRGDPALLNDFIGLQKDTRRRLIGVVERIRQSQIDSAATFNFTPFLAAARCSC